MPWVGKCKKYQADHFATEDTEKSNKKAWASRLREDAAKSGRRPAYGVEFLGG
jgi:hypothetical protein